MIEWWNPPPMYKGQDTFIIGGGPSLKNFDFQRLRPRATIGCNSAFRLGPVVCDICVFGDGGFYEAFRKELERFARIGWVVTVYPKLCTQPIPWLKKMKREPAGLHRAPSLGWNGNTGALAINLALIMGAARVFLLGFDMALGKAGEPNYHDYVIEKPNPAVYGRFLRGFPRVAADWKKHFGDREIINLNPHSKLDCFPKMEPEKILGEGCYDFRRAGKKSA